VVDIFVCGLQILDLFISSFFFFFCGRLVANQEREEWIRSSQVWTVWCTEL